ncbi:MAG: GGDEF domain-containing protein [Candidatus Dactylopiibacterium sp.]|nr:GGDEF domain-containing protein [Candidatus Dactylopiibacterium sp.]
MTKLRPFFLPLVCSLLVLALAAFALYEINALRAEQATRRTEAASRQVGLALQQQLNATHRLLDAIHAFRANADPAELGDFLARMLRESPPEGLVSVNLAPLVLPEDAAALIAAQHHAGLPEFTIRPAGQRPLMAPITLSRGPFGQLGDDPGQDLLADPELQPALTSARDSGRPAAAGRIMLRGRSGVLEPGFAIAAPIFRDGLSPDNVVERRARLDSWIVMSFSWRDWLRGVLMDVPEGVDLRLYANSANAPEDLLFATAQSAPAMAARISGTYALRLGEQPWRLDVTMREQAATDDDEAPARHILLAGIIVAALSFLLLGASALRQRQDKARLEQLEDAIQEAEERWRFALEGAGDGVWDWHIRSGGIRFSPRCDAILGVAEGRAASAPVHPEDEAAERTAMQACLEGRASQYASEHRMQGDDGQWRWIAARGMVTERDAKGAALRMIGTLSDITERKAASSRLQDMAQHDSLTGLPNRTLFFDRLQQALRMARRTQATLVLIYVDLDRFGAITSGFGQDTARRVLQEVARRLQKVTRDSDTVAHVGRDEYVILLPAMAAESDIHLVLDKIRPALEEDFSFEHRHLGLTASYGVALFPQHGTSAETLFNSAERAMNQARKSGGNTVCFSLARSE